MSFTDKELSIMFCEWYPTAVENKECAICLENLSTITDENEKLSCDHTFHKDCISKWSKNTCPCCRSKILTDLPDNFGIIYRSALDDRSLIRSHGLGRRSNFPGRTVNDPISDDYAEGPVSIERSIQALVNDIDQENITRSESVFNSFANRSLANSDGYRRIQQGATTEERIHLLRQMLNVREQTPAVR